MKKIILVEDNIADAELVKIAVSELELPVKIHHASGNDELFHFFETDDLSQVVLILLDLNMPRINGIEILKKLKATPRLSSIPVVVFTTSSSKTDVLACYDYGANAYVCKPIDYETFNENIKAIVQFWALNNLVPTRS
ncbi:MAG: response regulator [Saprospiraceae bacterium]